MAVTDNHGKNPPLQKGGRTLLKVTHRRLRLLTENSVFCYAFYLPKLFIRFAWGCFWLRAVIAEPQWAMLGPDCIVPITAVSAENATVATAKPVLWCDFIQHIWILIVSLCTNL